MNAPAHRHEVALLDLSSGSLDLMWRMASDMAESGLFGVKTAVQAMALMLVAQSEGRHPATIAQDYDIIQGKATRKTHSVLARYQAAGGKVEWHELTDQKADATFSHPAAGKLRMDWTFEQAKKAGLTGKDNWKNYPRAMLRARLIAEGVRATYPAAIGGDMVTEEAMDLPSPGEKFMGIAEEVRRDHVDTPAPTPAPAAYSQELFDKSFGKWSDWIASGRKTGGDVISFIESAGAPLTEMQKAKILSVKRAGDPQATVATPKSQTAALLKKDEEAFTPPSFAVVADGIAKAKDMDSLATVGDMIRHVTDLGQQSELQQKYEERERELRG